VGGSLLVVGVIGGFVPVLQGWIFILAGLSVMAPESATARRVLTWAKERVKSVRSDPSTSEAPQSEVERSGRPGPR
jgi:uncharacterized membrane protein YbaN (DUF454 family)